MSDIADSQSTSAPQIWGDFTSGVFKWSPGWPLPFDDLATLKLDGTYGDAVYAGATMKDGEHVRLGDGTTAYWDGAAWQVGKAPDAVVVVMQLNEPPCQNPGDYTIPQVKAHIETESDEPCVCAALALQNEQDGPGNSRGTLITWLGDYIVQNCLDDV